MKATAPDGQRDLDAKHAILKAIRKSLAATPDRAPEGPPGGASASPTPRGSAPPGMWRSESDALIATFREALEAVSGRCTVVGNEEEAAARIEEILAESKAATVAVSDAPLVGAVTRCLGPGRVLLQDADAAALFGCDVGITSAQWAVAETGTLVLESDAERHRLASLVPPVHVALVSAKRLRLTLAEVLDDIAGRATGPCPVVTFITGPSRTSDIELTLAIGVHGPGELHVIVVEEVSSE
jgi:L-lactate dehydrogenase complex protein LldG